MINAKIREKSIKRIWSQETDREKKTSITKDKIETEGDKIKTEKDKIETEGDKIETEGDKIETKEDKKEMMKEIKTRGTDQDKRKKIRK